MNFISNIFVVEMFKKFYKTLHENFFNMTNFHLIGLTSKLEVISVKSNYKIVRGINKPFV